MYKDWFFSCFILIFSVLTLMQVAQCQTAVEAPIVPESYTLMPGDNLLVTILGKTTYSYTTYVTYDGKMTINIPMSRIMEDGSSKHYSEVIDAIKVAKLTLKQAEDSI
ncbi:MAG: hypothetical protein ABIK67_06855, partial [candidate division WOR-3 bacterium]